MSRGVRSPIESPKKDVFYRIGFGVVENGLYEQTLGNLSRQLEIF